MSGWSQLKEKLVAMCNPPNGTPATRSKGPRPGFRMAVRETVSAWISEAAVRSATGLLMRTLGFR